MINSTLFDCLLNLELQDYIREHEKDDEKMLVLKHKVILGVPVAEVVQQIVGRRKSRLKLPLYYKTAGIIFPPKINLEQSSSEITAEFKTNLVTGALALDLTGGFGVDSLYLSRKFEEVVYVEKDEKLLKIAKHNHEVLGASNIKHICADAETYLHSSNEIFDLTYIDPSRRNSSLKKVYRFADCSPDVIGLTSILQERSKSVLIKASPLIDITQGMKDLGGIVSSVFVVGFDNECKEVLFLMVKNKKESTVAAVDLSDNPNRNFSFTLQNENKTSVSYSDPLHYLYEPNAMVLKAGAFKLVAKQFNLLKISANTHLYTSKELVKQFPGRVFQIQDYFKSDPKSAATLVPERKANIMTRNYPLSPAQLKKKLKLGDGGENFIIGFSGKSKKYLALAKRVK